jgi:ketosteroid isomerase-like protein
MTTRGFAVLIVAAGLAACGGTSGPVTGKERQAIVDSIMSRVGAFTETARSRDLSAYLQFFDTSADFRLAEDGKIFSTRDSLATAAGRYFRAHPSVDILWDPPSVSVLSPDAASYTSTYRMISVDSAGRSDTSLHARTIVFARRAKRWVMVHTHTSSIARPAPVAKPAAKAQKPKAKAAARTRAKGSAKTSTTKKRTTTSKKR